MKVSYENDSGRGAGYGLFRCSGLTVNDQCSFELERASDHNFLNGKDWTNQKTALKPLAVQQEGDDALLFLGPDIVDQLDMSETYRISVRAADQSTGVAGFRAQNIIYGQHAGTAGGMASASEPAPAAPAPEAEPVPEPEPAPEAEPVPQAAATPPEEEPKPQSITMPAPAPQKSSARWLVPLLLLVLLGLVAGGVWWFFFAHNGTTPPARPTPAQQESPAPAPASEPASQPASTPEAASQPASEPAPEPASKPAPAQAPGTVEKVNSFFSGQGRTPKAAAELSTGLAAGTAAEQDAIYRLLTYAGENGETSQLMAYGACLDPAAPAWGSIGKDAAAAWDIYEKAKAAGHAKAAEAQKHLRDWLKKEMAAGNGQAQRWLQSLPQE